MIGIFVAMESEVLACPEWTRNCDKVTLPGATVFSGEGAFVCQTGIGREAAQTAADAALDKFAPAVVLSVGLAGGLEPGIAVGEIVICTHVDHESHRHAESAQSIYAGQTLLEAALQIAEASDLPARTGTSLTVDEAAWGPAEKAAHHAWKSHDIVEMESFWIAAAASKRGLSFVAVRSISDSSADTLPNIGAMRPDGTLDQQKFLAYLQANPETGSQLSAMAQNSRLALTNLAAFLDAFLPSIAATRVA